MDKAEDPKSRPGSSAVSPAVPPEVQRWERATPLTEEEAEARLHQEGYSCYRWYDVPGTSYPRHWHDVDEVIWVLSGEIHITVGSETLVIRKGDRLDLPAKLAHTAVVPESGGVTYVVGKKEVELFPRLG